VKKNWKSRIKKKMKGWKKKMELRIKKGSKRKTELRIKKGKEEKKRRKNGVILDI